MKRNLKLISSIMIIFFFSLFCFGQNETQEEVVPDEKNVNSLQKSLLIPGWGQISEKRYVEGILFLSAEVFCFYKIISYNHKGNKNYDLYKKANNVNDAIKYRELSEKYDTRRNKYILAAAAVWAINLIDIYVIVKSKKKKNSNLKLKLESGENKKLAFTLSYSF